MRNYLFDKDFLYELDQYHHKELYIKIIALTFNENPIEQIEGRVTGGSINIDGTSSMRRSCSISLVAEDININDFYWGLNTKFRFEIGVKNEINFNYPDVIWFPQGTYIITNFNTSLGINNYTINISGKDKMCLLNGEVGGSLPSSIDFGSIDNYEYIYREIEISKEGYQSGQYYTTNHFDFASANNNSDTYIINPNQDIYVKNVDNVNVQEYVLVDNDINEITGDKYQLYTGKYSEDLIFYIKDYNLTKEDLTLKNIIREAVHTYGSEPYHNIIINDLDEKGLELMEYRGDKDLYVFYNVNKGEFENITFDETFTVYKENGSQITVKEASSKTPLVENFNDSATLVYLQNNLDPKFGPYIVAKLSYGDAAGYRVTDLTYAGQLISNPGESLTSMLDKIVNMLGDFEYFYDLDGRFIFQKKRTYINTNWSTIKGDGYDRYVENAAYSSPVTYSFEDNNLITSFQNAPNLLNLRNDYSIWGKRKGITGKDIPIHARYSIDKKPNYYKAFDGKIYASDIPYITHLLEIAHEEVVNNYEQAVNSFQPHFISNMPEELEKPKKINGIWTAGWWDIRDWAEYYKLILNTRKEPNGTMKWYSYNSNQGCVPRSTIDSNYVGNDWVWLVIYNPRTKTFNYQHGSGNPNQPKRTKTYYETIVDPITGELVDIRTNITEEFYYPFATCNDNHTYLKFLKEDVEQNGNYVYFYNPQFPGKKTREELLEESIDFEWQKFLESGQINLVDWREIIYQMAVDYYQYNNDIDDTSTVDGKKITLPFEGYTQDDFLFLVQENNIITEGDQQVFLYPGGYTGYEKYYIDMQGFWRDLYNPNVEPEYVYDGGYYESYNDYENNTEVYTVKTRYVDPYPVGLCNNYFLPYGENNENYNHIKAVIEAGLNNARVRELVNLAESYAKAPGVNKASSEGNEDILDWLEYAARLRDNWNTDTKLYLLGKKTAEDYNHLIEDSFDGHVSYIEQSNRLFENMFNTSGPNTINSEEFSKDDLESQKEQIEKKYEKLFTNLDYDLQFYFDEEYYYWNKDVLEYPEKLNFWIEFLDDAGELDQFSIPAIGDRPKVVNDNDVKAIYFREIPNLIYQYSSKRNSYDFKTGYSYINLPKSTENLFTISTLGKSAKEAVDTLLYNYSYCIETVTLNTIPVYYLEPNTRIFVHDENSKINGEYIVNRITVPLAYNGTMSIQANKVTERIY